MSAGGISDGGAEENDSSIRLPWSHSSRRLPTLVVRPLQSFLETEAAGGVFLLAATVAALVWANIGGSYERFWARPLSLSVSGWSVKMSLGEFAGEGLMTIFFFVAGLEIKRELTTGELRDKKVAALPMIAAAAGMAVPALIYAAFNANGAGARGWGIPMATDLAFVLVLVTVAGRGLPTGVRTFLLALAIMDDVLTIVVIAVFYVGGVDAVPLVVAAGLIGVMAALHVGHVRWMPIYVILGVGVWYAFLQSGVHAAIAGAVLGLLTPSRPFQRPAAVSQEAHRIAEETVDDPQPPDSDAHLWLRLTQLSREAVSPLARLEGSLHPWSSFLVVPLFALANVGVDLSGGALGSALRSPVTVGIVLGRVVGKAVGITGGAYVAVRMGVAVLPMGVRWNHIFAAAVAAGIGLAVSLFVAQAAFTDPALLEEAKVGILVGSAIAAVAGWFLLRRAGRARVDP